MVGMYIPKSLGERGWFQALNFTELSDLQLCAAKNSVGPTTKEVVEPVLHVLYDMHLWSKYFGMEET